MVFCFFFSFLEKNFFDICLFCFDSIMAVKVVILRKKMTGNACIYLNIES